MSTKKTQSQTTRRMEMRHRYIDAKKDGEFRACRIYKGGTDRPCSSRPTQVNPSTYGVRGGVRYRQSVEEVRDRRAVSDATIEVVLKAGSLER